LISIPFPISVFFNQPASFHKKRFKIFVLKPDINFSLLLNEFKPGNINMANKYLTSWRNYDIGRAWKKLMHENSALMHNSNFVIKSFDFESRVESIARSGQLLVLAVPSAAHGGPFTKTEAKKAFKLSSEAARLEAAAP
jgi:hypothetical protein